MSLLRPRPPLIPLEVPRRRPLFAWVLIGVGFLVVAGMVAALVLGVVR